MELSSSVYLAALGALCIQLLPLLELYKVPKNRRPNFRDLTYWIPYIVAPVVGGIVGYAYFNEQEGSSLLAMHIGASAPLILRSMASLVPSSVGV